MLARLSAADRELVQGVVAIHWYDLKLQHRVFEAFEASFDSSDFQALPELTRYIVDQDITLLHRMFFRIHNPVYVLEKCGDYWKRSHDGGVWYVQRLSATSARGELSQIPDSAPVFCRFLQTYIQFMIGLAGVKAGNVLHRQCVCRGAPSCVFEGSWT